MCMSKFDVEFILQNDMVFNLAIFRRQIVHALCNQLLLEFSLHPFSILHTCYRPIEHVHEES